MPKLMGARPRLTGYLIILAAAALLLLTPGTASADDATPASGPSVIKAEASTVPAADAIDAPVALAEYLHFGGM